MIIKNRYFLSLINEILNRLNNIIKYIKLNLKNTYYRIRIRKNINKISRFIRVINILKKI